MTCSTTPLRAPSSPSTTWKTSQRAYAGEVRNLGPLTQAELASVGIYSAEQMAELGWPEVCLRWVEAFPARANLNAFAAVIGAIDGVDWRKIDPLQKEAARKLAQRLRRRSDP